MVKQYVCTISTSKNFIRKGAKKGFKEFRKVFLKNMF